ncbi:ABC transporter ATP-binding protein [Spirulina major CS-329]|uniref:ABC transporter ATP-binding protein n=1 Tax=Spirulina TaxID=1154 RepID=UPI00232FC582|nr:MULTISPECIES: ABC transporter ATP-binding protein [Spirulina]MDB9493190.1 ABC transporter ATP-binding protein [Spirulina subsalsa CS-330]MDB9501972.1 ABC transporter ATP-binding protein [Spirulina major CS-329]
MTDWAIRVDNLGKKYTIRHQRQHQTLRHALTDGLRNLKRGRSHHPAAPTQEEFWALSNISFTIQQGDRVGIIGRNGAGKSTLLKLLSRITEPTTGRIHLRGRVASLLEVGTGFHPELTGRENIFLNGSILGMERQEILKKFDEIVAFAEVERFLDTPVKRYSSGMYVRLAFAVAAHLETEILIIDEVLAVGDLSFQKKCLGRMEEVGKEGKTVLFVSHQMGLVSQLCNYAFFLENGQLKQEGEPRKIIEKYLEEIQRKSNQFEQKQQLKKRFGIQKASTSDRKGQTKNQFSHDESIILSLYVNTEEWHTDAVFSVTVYDMQGRKVFTHEYPCANIKLSEVCLIAKIEIPSHFLTPGFYYFSAFIHVPNVICLDAVTNICEFNITDLGSEFAKYGDVNYGCVFADCQWDFVQVSLSC